MMPKHTMMPKMANEPTMLKPTMKDRISIQKQSNNSLIPDNYPLTPKLDTFNVDAEDNQLPEGFFLICEGARRSGKSIFLKWLLYHYKKKFDLAIVMTETPQNGFWQPIVSNQYVHSGWDPFLVTKLFDQQIKEIEKNIHDKTYKPRRCLLILDDIIGDRQWIHDDATLNRLAVEGRHYKISVALTTQEPKAIGTALRNNCDVCLVFQQKSRRGKESVCDDFLRFKLDYKWQADDLLKTYTKNHDCILIEMHKVCPEPFLSYWHVPADMTFDKEKDKIKCPKYQLGSEEQKRLAKTEKGSLPLFSREQNSIHLPNFFSSH
jgi:hypothetical protein